MNKVEAIVGTHDLDGASYKNYVMGFVISIVFTLISYTLAVNHVFHNKWILALVIAAFAVAQAATQLRLFLHLGEEAKPRLRLLVFGFMMMVVLILIGGSVWIMHNLNYHMMTPKQINTYMNSQDGGL